MKQLKTIISIIGIILKYGVILTAAIKALNVFFEDIKNIDTDNEGKVINE
jgi:hypothetical protein